MQVQRVPTRDLGDMTGRLSNYELNVPVRDRLHFKRISGGQTDETWSVTNGSSSADTSNFEQGSQSVAIAVNSGATATATCVLPTSPATARGNVGVLLYLDSLDTVDTITLRIEESEGNGYDLRIYNRAATAYPHSSTLLLKNRFTLQANEWRYVWLDRQDSVAVGSPTAWGTSEANAEYSMTRVSLIVVAASGQTPTVNLQGVYSQCYPRGGCSWIFDDQPAHLLETVLPVFKRLGWRGGLSVVAGWAGYDSPAYGLQMTAAQIQEFVDAGWDIHPHGYWTGLDEGGSQNDHYYLAPGRGRTLSDALAEVERSQKWIKENEWFRAAHIYAPPGNTFGLDNYSGGESLPDGIKMARAKMWRSGSETNTESVSNRNTMWMPADPYQITYNLITSVGSANAAPINKAVIDHSICTFLGHDVYTPLTYGDTEEIFLAAVELVRAAGLENVTLSDVWDRSYGRQSLTATPRVV